MAGKKVGQKRKPLLPNRPVALGGSSHERRVRRREGTATGAVDVTPINQGTRSRLDQPPVANRTRSRSLPQTVRSTRSCVHLPSEVVSSIRDGSRIPSRATGRQRGSSCEKRGGRHGSKVMNGTPVAAATQNGRSGTPRLSSLAAVTPGSGGGAAAPPSSSLVGDTLTDPLLGRVCYCDKACLACLEHKCNEDHRLLSCSGTCGRFFHVDCTGWHMGSRTDSTILKNPCNDGASAQLKLQLVKEMEQPCKAGIKHRNVRVPQDDTPWYCTKCWEMCKRAHRKLPLGIACANCSDVPPPAAAFPCPLDPNASSRPSKPTSRSRSKTPKGGRTKATAGGANASACQSAYQSSYQSSHQSSHQRSCETPYKDLPTKEQARRLGLMLPGDEIDRSKRDFVKAHGQHVKRLLSEEHYDAIASHSPRPYPTEQPMDKDVRDRMAVHGRRFEITQLLFSMKECHSCGVLEPFHDDPLVVTSAKERLGHRKYIAEDPMKRQPSKFPRSHFCTTFHSCFVCSCGKKDCAYAGGYWCSGNQSYKDHEEYRSFHPEMVSMHPGKRTPQALFEWGQERGEDVGLREVTLCERCKPCPRKKGERRKAPKLSRLNGYGPHVAVEPMCRLDGVKAGKVRRLCAVLKGLTLAEEAAIRAVVPLVQVARLSAGNIASKGNISCVFQETSWSKVLPHLPEECKIIVLKRERGQKGALPSYRFRKEAIEEALTLLEDLRPPHYLDFEFDRDRLEKWPSEGNLLDSEVVPVPTVDPQEEEDEDEKESPAATQNPPHQQHSPSPQEQATPEEGAHRQPQVTPVPSRAASLPRTRAASNSSGPTGPTSRRAAPNSSGAPGPTSSTHNDDGDFGPAPLQLGEAEEEEFSGVEDASAPKESMVENAMNGRNAIVEAHNELLASEHKAGRLRHRNLLDRPPTRNGILNDAKYQSGGHRSSIPFELSRCGKTATINGTSGVMSTTNTGFVNMMTHPYAWAKAFPRVFLPTLREDGTLEVYNDWTGFGRMRQTSVSYKEWARHLMWSKDQRAQQHPMLALVLNNVNFKNQLQGQGRYALKLDDIASSAGTVEEWIDTLEKAASEGSNRPNRSNNRARPVNAPPSAAALNKQLTYVAGNVPGSDPYFGQLFRKWKAVNFYLSYAKGKEATFFHTASMAEYHDPALRSLLAKYCEATGQSNTATEILEDDRCFHKAVQRNKHVVTHFFAFKWEMWYGIFLKNVIGLEHAMSRYEFAKSRGMIHAHSILHTKGEGSGTDEEHEGSGTDRIGMAIHEMAVDSYKALLDLDEYLMNQGQTPYHAISYSNRYEREQVPHPGSAFEVEGGFKQYLEAVEAFLCRKPKGKAAWRKYEAELSNAKANAEKAIETVLRERLAVGAWHPGQAPKEWLGPHGAEELGYAGWSQGVANQMLDKDDVLKKKELGKFKFERESHLYCRKVNTTNHIFLHSCSEYCWRDTHKTEPFEQSKHCDPRTGELLPDVTSKFDRKGQSFVKILVRACRFKYGYQLGPKHGRFTDRTGGKISQRCFELQMNADGVPEFTCKRNHHKVLQEPLACMHFGANNDLARFLTHCTPHEDIPKADGSCGGHAPSPEEVEKFYRALHVMGMPGLIRAFGADRLLFYCTGYCCKGSQSSREWSKTLDQLVKDYINGTLRPANGSKMTVRGLVSRFMYKISGKRDVPSDEARFILAGGSYNFSTVQLRSCSVGSLFTQQLKASLSEAEVDDAGEVKKSGTNFLQLTKAYKEFMQKVDQHPSRAETNLYLFTAHHFKGASKDKPHAPSFYGFQDQPSWPLTENYSKVMLTLYKPWKESPDDNLHPQDNTFKTSLEEFMYDPLFPQQIAVKILQRKLKFRCQEEAELTEPPQHGPEEEAPRPNSQNDEAADLAEGAENRREDDPESNGDLSQSELEALPEPPEDHDWSANRVANAEDWWHQTKTKFYEEQARSILKGEEEPLQLFDTELYRPQNARGTDQKLLIGSLLLQLHSFHCFVETLANRRRGAPRRSRRDLAPPDTMLLYVQGNPGAGKTFCSRTMINSCRRYFRANRTAKAIAPTGCAASLLKGGTFKRDFKVPCGAKAKQDPSDDHLPKETEFLQAFILSMCSIFALFKDEHSMDSRSDWGWLKHRLESARNFCPIISNLVEDEDESGQGQEAGDVGKFEVGLAELQKKLHLGHFSDRPFALPFLASMGDCQQLPPVAAKAHYDLVSSPRKGDAACAAGRIAVSEFLNPAPGQSCHGITIVMQSVQRQNEGPFLTVLNNMRDGKVTSDDVELLETRLWSKLSSEERELFEDTALWLFPTWDRTKPATIKYLTNLRKPIAKIRSKYTFPSNGTSGTNHARSEINLPDFSALCVGAVVMLLVNFIVEKNLKNGSVGTIREIIYENQEGPREEGALPLYVVVEFPDSEMPIDLAWNKDNPKLVAIPALEIRCEKRCCSQQTIPLRVCKAITIYKSQGMTIGNGDECFWKRVVVGLPTAEGRNRSPGQELVGLSRATDIEVLAIHDEDPKAKVSQDSFFNIGMGASCEKKRQFEQHLLESQGESQVWLKSKISSLDPSGRKDFDRGYEFLCSWLDEKCSQNHPDTEMMDAESEA